MKDYPKLPPEELIANNMCPECLAPLRFEDGCYYWFKEPHQFVHILSRCVMANPGTWEEFCPASWTGTGTHHFSYALRFHDGEWRSADPQRRSLELRYPAIVGRTDCPVEPTLPATGHSFLSIDGPAILSAYYGDGAKTYVRFYESEGAGGSVTVSLDWEPQSAQTITLQGETGDTPVEIAGRTVRLSLGPWQIATLELTRG